MTLLLWIALAVLIIGPIVSDRLQTQGWFKCAAAIEWIGAITISIIVIIWVVHRHI